MTTKHSITTISTVKDPQQKVETIQLTKRLQVITPDKKVIHDTGDTPSRSFVRAFLTTIRGCFTWDNTRALDTNGVDNRLVNWRSGRTAAIYIEATYGEDRFGLVIGTGPTPPTNDDFRLAAQIKDGTGTSQMEHQRTTVRGPELEADALVITTERIFLNRTHHPQTVNECGIYALGNDFSRPRYFCHIRDLVIPEITVPPEHGIILQYRILTRV